jgi:hypothetical protein
MNTLFFKSPPQITVSEMSADLPSTDVAFEASGCTEVQSGASSSRSPSKSGSLKNLMSLLLGEVWLGIKALDLAWFSTEHLMCLMFGLSLEIALSARAPTDY